MKTRKKKSLPSLPSSLVRVARQDLMAVRRMKRVTIDMSTWQTPEAIMGSPTTRSRATTEAPCHVCQAGAVMVQSLGTDINETMSPEDFPERIQAVLYGLDALRRSRVLYFVLKLARAGSKRVAKWIEDNGDKQFIEVAGYCSYEYNPEQYIKWLKAVEKWLKSEGM